MQLEHYIKAEQAKALQENLILVLVGTMGVVAVTTWVFWSVAPKAQLLAWLILACIINIARWLSCRNFRADLDVSREQIQTRLNSQVFWGFIVGLHWGLIPLFFLTNEVTIYTLFVTSVYTGFVSSAMSTDTAYFPSFFSFALPSSILFVARALYEGGTLYLALAVLVAFFLVMLSYLSLNAQSFFKKSQAVNHQNMRLMQELRVQKETAEQATVAKDQFLAAASHDLRQPLNAIGLFIDVLGSVDMEQKGRQVVRKIQQSLTGLNEMLHGMLDISRLDSSVVENNPTSINLSQIVSTIAAEYQTKANSKGLTFNLDVPLNTVVFADTILLQRVVRNILDNAVKYTFEGSVSLSANRQDGHVELLIADTGVGIPAEHQSNVFEEFHQLSNPERNRTKGLGLGLAIVKRLCQLMDVGLSLHSEIGSGTLMRLWLKSGERSTRVKRTVDSRTNWDGLEVTVIDDETDILAGMHDLLTYWGCKVTVGESYNEALAALSERNNVPNLIIADFRLRDHATGLDAIDLLREEYNKYIPAILITGDTSPDKVRQATDADLEVLYKPISVDDLRRCMTSLLGSKEHRL